MPAANSTHVLRILRELSMLLRRPWVTWLVLSKTALPYRWRMYSLNISSTWLETVFLWLESVSISLHHRILQAVAILQYATLVNFALMASPIQAALSSPLYLKCCYAGYPPPPFFLLFLFFDLGTKCCFEHAGLIMLQHKRLPIWLPFG